MDHLRGHFADGNADEHPFDDDHIGHEPLPMAVGQAERRLQVRAYNFWAGLLGSRQFPPVSALDEKQPDFFAFAALLDISEGSDDPAIGRIGTALAEESGGNGTIAKLSDAPERSLLSRIAAHYRQVLASQAPVSFDAEFVNWRGATILYRGILLPFSRDDDAIDHVLCVINWKEALEPGMAGALQQEIAASLEPLRRLRLEPDLPGWADGPAEQAECPVEDLAARLRALPPVPLADLCAQDQEFTLVLARRQADDEVVVLGKLPHEPQLIERASRRVLACGAPSG